MTGPAAAAPSHAPPRRRRRSPWRLLSPLVLAGMLLAGVLAWALGTASGLRSLVAVAEGLSAGRLEIHAPAGRLAGPLQLERLRFHNADLQLDIRRLALEWSPAALWSGRLQLDRLTADSLQLSLAQDPAAAADATPTAVPQSLALPLAFELARLELGRFELYRFDPRRPDPPFAAFVAGEPWFRFSALSAALASDGRQHRLSGLALTLAQGRVELSGELGAHAPFALSAQGRIEAPSGQLQLLAAHTLLEPHITLAARGEGLNGRAELQLKPFAAWPLQALKLDEVDFDPSAWQSALPALSLPRAALRLHAELIVPAEADGPALRGPVRIENRSPAALDRGGLPLQSLSARLHWQGQGQGQALALDALELRMPQRGQVRGTLHWRPAAAATAAAATAPPWNPLAGLGRIDARLDLADIDPAAIDTRLPRQRLAGQIAIGSPWQAAGPQLELALTLGKARLEAHAGLMDDAADLYTFFGRVRNLDPRTLLATAPDARLNVDFDLQLHPGSGPRVQGSLALPDSRFGVHPLAAQVRFALERQTQGWRLSALQLALDLAGNRLRADGSWGAADDSLTLSAALPALGALGYGLDGQAAVEGRIGGGLDAPRGALRFFAAALQLPGAMTLRGLNGEASLEAGADGPFRLAVGLSGLQRQGESLLDTARLVAEGTRAQHRMNFELEAAGQNRLGGVLEGGLQLQRSGPQWSGYISALESAGRLAARLSAPAALELAADRLRLGEALILAGEQGRIHLQQTVWTPAESLARGRLSGLVLDLQPSRRADTRPRSGTLVLGAEWDLRAGSTLAGTARVFREAGDLVVEGEMRTRLGLEALQLQLQAVGTQLRLNGLLQGRELGRIDAAAVLPFERSADGRWQPAWQAPVQGRARFEMPSIAWLGRLLEENIELGGRLDGEIEFAGSLAEPRLDGQLAGQALQFALLDQGLQLRDGELALRFDSDRVRLERLAFAAPHRVRVRDRRIPFQPLTATQGGLTASGELVLASGAGSFEFSAQRLPVLQHPERWLMLSGGGRMRSSWRTLDVEADLRVDAAALEFADTPAPTLSEDVIVLQRGAPETGAGIALGLRARIDLGEALYLSAMGVDTRLAGELQLSRQAGGPLQAVGTVSTVGGSYRGYGQQLTVERGLINFNGAPDNPGLNIVALRKGLAVEAGVEILGSARRPLVRLASEPVVPDPEKLSWMVLGRAPDAASGADLGLLLPAAQALLGGPGGGMTEQLAHSLGFDSISIGQGELNRTTQRATSRVAGGGTTVAGGPTVSGQVLSVGKRLGSGLMLSFEKGLGEAETLVRLSYQLSRRLSLILRGGADNAIDLEYGFSFR